MLPSAGEVVCLTETKCTRMFQLIPWPEGARALPPPPRARPSSLPAFRPARPRPPTHRAARVPLGLRPVANLLGHNLVVVADAQQMAGLEAGGQRVCRALKEVGGMNKGVRRMVTSACYPVGPWQRAPGAWAQTHGCSAAVTHSLVLLAAQTEARGLCAFVPTFLYQLPLRTSAWPASGLCG